ncbi:MAG TPA: 50S ribosomal protein L35 [Candidatus Saccharimonadales bacterium]|nr:50S ribosomal protein L35 [Candidatus Saccharimonadales bacterium]
MPKMKSNRAAAKRYRVTGTGKIVRNHARTRHLKTGKSPKNKRQLSSSVVLKPADAKRARRLLGI